MSKYNIFDPERFIVRVMAGKCDTCIFRPGNLMHLQEGRVDEMVEECLANDEIIPCHKTLYDNEDEPLQAICFGLYESHWRDILPLRMAKVFGIIRWFTPNKVQATEVDREEG